MEHRFREGIKKTQIIEELNEDEEIAKEITNEPRKVEHEEVRKSSKIEEYIDYLYILYPKLVKHWNIISLVAAVIILFVVLVSLYNSYMCSTDSSSGPQVKETSSAGQKYPWWNSGLQQKQRTQ